MSGRRAMLPLILILGLGLGLLSIPVFAQDGLPLPVDPSGNTLGELTAGAPSQRFVVASTGSESVQIQIFGITAGFAPRLRVLDPSAAVVLDIANPTLQNTIGGTVFFAAPGAYTIEIAGEQGSSGQFMLSLQPGAALPTPVELVVGQQIAAVVGAESPLLIYEFATTDAAALTLTVLSQLVNAGPAFSLSDATTGRVIATSDGTLLGVMHYLTATNTRYRIEIQAGGAGQDVPFTICLGCTSEALGSAAPAATAEAVAACAVRSAVGGAVNVRSGPGTQYLIVGSLLSDQSFPVTGQIAGGSWYQIDYNGQAAWVGASVTTLEGDCAAVPVVSPPSNAPLAPVILPTSTLSSAATVTATTDSSTTTTPTATTDSSTTATATATATATEASATATATATSTPTDSVPPPVETEET